MAYVTLDQLKLHCNIDFSTQQEDSYLLSILEASERRIEKEIQQPLSGILVEDTLDSPLVAAILIFAGTLYANREAVAYATATPVPYTLSFLLAPYIKYT